MTILNATAFYSVKGGVGCTTTAALAALAAAANRPTTIVDLCGDVPAAFGLVDRGAAPAAGDEWEAHIPDHDLNIVVAGYSDRIAAQTERRTLIVDAGNLRVITPLEDGATRHTRTSLTALCERRLLVTTNCLLAVRAATNLPITPTGIVLIVDAGRPLTGTDVEEVTGHKVIAQIPHAPELGRAVDSGLASWAGRATAAQRHLTCDLEGALP